MQANKLVSCILLVSYCKYKTFTQICIIIFKLTSSFALRLYRLYSTFFGQKLLSTLCPNLCLYRQILSKNTIAPVEYFCSN